jgi:hypothetical protein
LERAVAEAYRITSGGLNFAADITIMCRKKTVRVLAERLEIKKSRGDRTLIELFISEARRWEACLQRLVGTFSGWEMTKRHSEAVGGAEYANHPGKRDSANGGDNNRQQFVDARDPNWWNCAV